MAELPVGKIHMEVLEKLLLSYTRSNGRVAVGAGIGEDAAVIEMGDGYLIAKTDPITCVTDEVGHYLVNINANDIAAMGGTPRWFLATILMPEGSSDEDLENIFAQISASCFDLGIIYCGGHTEVTTGVENPIVVGQMLGEAKKNELKPTTGAQCGDDLVITKTAAIEATAIIARERYEELRDVMPEEFLQRARNYLYDPGISVVRDSLVVKNCEGVHALHDPTEGGIATGIYEMALASNLGVQVLGDEIPVSEETRILCSYFDVDPLGTFASGSLLIAVSPSATGEVIRKLAEADIAAKKVGELVEQERGMWITRDAELSPLIVFHQDELSRIFG